MNTRIDTPGMPLALEDKHEESAPSHAQADTQARIKSSAKANAKSSAKPSAKKLPKQIAFTDDPLWYKDAVIYQIHIKSYSDANHDGIGDFAGLIDKLDYISGLGVNTIWLLPFYPSPRRDDGYDIADYKGVDPDYGSMADARRFIAEAHARGLRIITELVINHTSDQHPWFQRARKAKPGSAARDFYVWADDDKGYDGTRIIFLDTEKSNWTWDPVANAYFWHRFYSHQPDLNFDNPQVLKSVLGVMSFWLDLGIDGLRLDAVPYLIEREGTSNENLPETHDILRKIRAHLDWKYPDRMLLAEANMWPEDVQQYFGESDECHMAFHFPLMPRMYMALARQDRFPITDILRQTPDIPADCQWAIFLRNHDELTLEMVTETERDYLWNFYASDRRARINLGIRRRLAPLLERDGRRIQLLNSFLLSMPGTPVIYYGDEIGMGDNIHLGDRDGVRTPMQWTPDRNGGFSRADPASLVLPPIMDAQYGFQVINVESQNSDRHSLLNWMRRMLSVRKQHRAFGRGTLKLLFPSNRKILAYLREFTDPHTGAVETILCVANVSQSAQAVELDLSAFAGRIPVEMLGGTAFPPIGQGSYLLTLPPYGFFWFALAIEAHMPTWFSPTPEPLPELFTLVIRQGVDDMLKAASRTILEQEVLPSYLPKRRWFSGKQQKPAHAHIALATVLPLSKLLPGALPILLTEIETSGAEGAARYLLPLGFIKEEDTVTALPQQLALARIRRNSHIGLLTDAFTLDSFAMTMVELTMARTKLPTEDGVLHFVPSDAFAVMTVPQELAMRRISLEQSNSSLVIGDEIMLKLIRRLHTGIHPEIEMGRYLTEHGYANTPATLGEVKRIAADGTPTTLVVLQQFIHNQSDGWQWTLDTLERAILQENAGMVDATLANYADGDGVLGELEHGAALLGRRLSELHTLLSRPTYDPAFSPEIATIDDAADWTDKACAQVNAALDILHSTQDWADSETARVAQALAARRTELLGHIGQLATAGIGSLRIRLHGDLHLGQVLVSSGDVYFIDFEGEPSHTLEQRRGKNSPLRDVAGMLRSFEYAAAFANSIGPADLSEAAQTHKKNVLASFTPLCQLAFLDAYYKYLETDFSTVSDVLMAQRKALLDLFILEKAAYEICYDAAHRPAWLPVPLSGMKRIVERLLDGLEPAEG
ncbi:maltose alpha-D-glucosyltransferase [Herbaspirillum sp. RTI4]|uniref:maltose alpha-D-glucosyltransferase n=1 Tax=Herbaspirillum sp. RTI4 TaxID=3048640 RepID=UPI002AB46BAD|nr:maltose alpha-D-glucosyltransferase [Herbaspirillum sp. RTI4]MDY7579066.1 maltose alpha-D-glucosyltransferase [Herbaspirillum sp. RTI4]MEA9982350.1 maltose alpha-D-glucosyltransferase [Herbaspirillum sp. RTI4]